MNFLFIFEQKKSRWNPEYKFQGSPGPDEDVIVYVFSRGGIHILRKNMQILGLP